MGNRKHNFIVDTINKKFLIDEKRLEGVTKINVIVTPDDAEVTVTFKECDVFVNAVTNNEEICSSIENGIRTAVKNFSQAVDDTV